MVWKKNGEKSTDFFEENFLGLPNKKYFFVPPSLPEKKILVKLLQKYKW